MTAGAVASGHARVTDAAARLLADGGNAFDAAVAAGFAAAAAEPMFTSLGGGGFLLARTADRREVAYDFFADAPGRGAGESTRESHFVPMTVHFAASDQVFNIGLGSVAVPGTLAGLLHVHAALGRVPLAQVVAPSVSLARDGVELNAHQAYALRLLEPINALTEGSRTLYIPGGRIPGLGERLHNRALADFIERLPDGAAASLYGGDLAEQVDREMREGGGLLSAEDLAAYRVAERDPLVCDRGGLRVLTNPPPSFGGELLVRALLLHHDLGTSEWGSGEDLVCRVAVMQEVDRQRESGEAFDRDAAVRRLRSTGGTTHVSVVDGEGNAASLSLSNGEGSGYVVPDTGMMLNNMLGEDDLHPEGFGRVEAGARIASMMCPTIVLDGDTPLLALGSGGSKRIRSAIAQVLTARVDHGLALAECVDAPRLHWDGECVQVEPGFDEVALAALEARWPVNRWPETSLYFGGVHAVAGTEAAAADPRREGFARLVA